MEERRVLQNSKSYNAVGTCHGMSNLQMLEYQQTCHGMSLQHTGRITTIDSFCNTHPTNCQSGQRKLCRDMPWHVRHQLTGGRNATRGLSSRQPPRRELMPERVGIPLRRGWKYLTFCANEQIFLFSLSLIF